MSSARPAAAAAGLLVTLAFAAGAWASHDSTELVSTGPAGGNGAATVAYAGASEDGGRVYFQTIESLVAADTDARTDVYERSGTTTGMPREAHGSSTSTRRRSQPRATPSIPES